MYREFMDAGPVTDPHRAAPVAPLPAATGNPELDQVTGAARRWRGALAERDRAILAAAFDAGILGQTIAEAAGMSVAGVYRLPATRRGAIPPEVMGVPSGVPFCSTRENRRLCTGARSSNGPTRPRGIPDDGTPGRNPKLIRLVS
jgi:hypothetical protein